jgi:hypothetical protein
MDWMKDVAALWKNPDPRQGYRIFETAMTGTVEPFFIFTWLKKPVKLPPIDQNIQL